MKWRSLSLSFCSQRPSCRGSLRSCLLRRPMCWVPHGFPRHLRRPHIQTCSMGEEHEPVRVFHEQRLRREVLVRAASSRFFISDAPLGTKFRALRTGELCADLGRGGGGTRA